jgi:hypothetical protein
MAELIETRAGHAQGDVRTTVSDYRAFHDNGGGSVESRKSRYGEMVSSYYDLATDIYEKGWGDSFHFAPRYRGERFEVSIARHQHYLAHRLGLARKQQVLDVGCAAPASPASTSTATRSRRCANTIVARASTSCATWSKPTS